LKNIDKLRRLSSHDLAQKLVFDSEGEQRSPCGVCAAWSDCHDNCYKGVLDWLESEVKIEKTQH